MLDVALVQTTSMKAPSGAERLVGSNHRKTMRSRLLSEGPSSFTDAEILEMLLFLAVPRADVRPLVKKLISRYGSLSAVLLTDSNTLSNVDGLDAASVEVLGWPAYAADALACAEIREKPILGNWEMLTAYLDVVMSSAVPGQLRVLLLDSSNRLLADEVVDASPQDLAFTLGGRALETHATALILIRVLPEGRVPKGLAQREAAQGGPLIKKMAALSVVVHDYLIVGRGTWTSLRQKGLLPS